MKKTYISPNMLVVRFGMTQPLAASPAVGLNASSETSTFDVKESSTVNDVNVWDEEW